MKTFLRILSLVALIDAGCEFFFAGDKLGGLFSLGLAILMRLEAKE